MTDVFNPQYPNETLPFPYTAPDKGQSYHAVDPTIYPGSFNYKKMFYSGSNVAQIDYYSGASSLTLTGSLQFSEQYQYDNNMSCSAILYVTY